MSQVADGQIADSSKTQWKGAEHISVAVWISTIIVLVVCLNIFAIQIYGEAEFIFASIKIITIVGLLTMAFIVDLGGGPKHDRLGFRYCRYRGNPTLSFSPCSQVL